MMGETADPNKSIFKRMSTNADPNKDIFGEMSSDSEKDIFGDMTSSESDEDCWPPKILCEPTVFYDFFLIDS